MRALEHVVVDAVRAAVEPLLPPPDRSHPCAVLLDHAGHRDACLAHQAMSPLPPFAAPPSPTPRLGSQRVDTPIPPGPLRERLEEVSVRVAACEIECVRVAERGLQLSQAVAETDLDALRNRYQAAAADPSRGSLVEAYGRELASAERLAGLVDITTQRLQQLGAELNSAVNTGIEIALAPSNDKTFELLLDQLDALRASLEVVEQEAGPTAI